MSKGDEGWLADHFEAAYQEYLRGEAVDWYDLIASTTDSQSDARRGQVIDRKGEVKVIDGDCAND